MSILGGFITGSSSYKTMFILISFTDFVLVLIFKSNQYTTLL